MFVLRIQRRWWTAASAPILAAALLLGVAPTSAPAAASSATALTNVKTVTAHLSFAQGTYTAYRFSSTGSVTASRRASLSRASSAPATQIATRAGKTYYFVSAGIWAGYWMPAGSGINATLATSAPAAASSATALTNVKTVTAHLSFAQGTYTAYRFSSTGSVTASRRASLSRASSAPATQIATRAGKTYYFVSAGIWAGYWMPAGSGINATLATSAPAPTPPPPTSAPATPAPSVAPEQTPAASATPAPSAAPASVRATFTDPAAGKTTVLKAGIHDVAWTETGPVTQRAITEQYGKAVNGRCSGVAWKTAWTHAGITTPYRISGFGLGYCYRYTLTLNGKETASSGALLLSAGTFTENFYNGATVRYQDPDYTACVATSTEMMLNFVATKGAPGPGFRWAVTTSYSAEESILRWERAHMTQVTAHAGVDANGWRNGLNYYGWGSYTSASAMRYQVFAYPSYDAALKSLVQAIAKYNKPVGFLGWAGGHAQIVNGYRVTGLDPATSSSFTVTAIYLTDPLSSDRMRNYAISAANFRSGSTKYRFRPYIYTDSPYDDPYSPGTAAAYRAWYGKWVIVAPVR